MSNLSITIIIASLYDDKALKESIASCLSQTDVSLDIIISLKDSTNVPRIDHTVKSGKPLIFIRRNDRGIADAWNHAIDHVNTDYTGFLGAGDHFSSSTSLYDLINQSSKLSTNNTVLYGDQQIVRPDGNIEAFPSPRVGNEKRALRGHMVIPHASSLWPTLLLKHFRFDESFRISLDYEYALRTLSLVHYHHVPTHVAVITTGGLSNKPEYLLRVVLEDLRAKRQNGIFPFSSISTNAKRILRWMITSLK